MLPAKAVSLTEYDLGAEAALSNSSPRRGHDRGMGRHREALIEFHRVGAYVKVSAVDPETLTEVSIVGDPAAGEETLRRTAVRKLDYVLKRNREKR